MSRFGLQSYRCVGTVGLIPLTGVGDGVDQFLLGQAVLLHKGPELASHVTGVGDLVHESRCIRDIDWVPVDQASISWDCWDGIASSLCQQEARLVVLQP